MEKTPLRTTALRNLELIEYQEAFQQLSNVQATLVPCAR